MTESKFENLRMKFTEVKIKNLSYEYFLNRLTKMSCDIIHENCLPCEVVEYLRAHNACWKDKSDNEKFGDLVVKLLCEIWWIQDRLKDDHDK